MQLIKSAAAIAIALSSLPLFSTPSIAQIDRQEWISFGRTNNGELLQLNTTSIQFRMMLIDDTINEEGGYEGNMPRIKVVAFDYSIDGRKRSAYTKSCQGRNVAVGVASLKENRPSWKTYTSFLDYWPQYFRVEADSIASQKMLQRVCLLSANKK